MGAAIAQSANNVRTASVLPSKQGVEMSFMMSSYGPLGHVALPHWSAAHENGSINRTDSLTEEFFKRLKFVIIASWLRKPNVVECKNRCFDICPPVHLL
jgi:hypothetical protein